MGRQAARDQDRRQSAGAQDQYGRRPRRQVGALRQPARGGRGTRLRPVAAGRGGLSRFTLAITATPADIDELGHVNNAVWAQWIQQIATAHWQKVAPPAHQADHLWVVTRHEIDYRGNVGPRETVIGETWVDKPPPGARFDRNVRFTGPDGQVN